MDDAVTVSDLIKGIEQLLTVFALGGVVWSAYMFIRSASVVKEDRRKIELSKWRKVEVQKTLMISKVFMSTDEIVNALRNSSFDEEIDIKRGELSESSVRVLLMELIADNIVGQFFPDRYGITQLPRDITAPTVIENIHANSAVRDAFSNIIKHPGRFDTSQLYKEKPSEIVISESDFVLALSDLTMRNVANKNDEGKWTANEIKSEAEE